ncbi:hypothetical protein ACFFX0_29410 [Citricoccus parietis]|uniref:Uncharacterized protein n=1 Tax=Citricoccus parietis TaxID=592307 RepID=A0ABV5G7Z5_9MICC
MDYHWSRRYVRDAACGERGSRLALGRPKGHRARKRHVPASPVDRHCFAGRRRWSTSLPTGA